MAVFSKPVHMQPALEQDFSAIWEIFHLIVLSGNTISFPPETTYDQAKEYWMGKGMHAYKAVKDGIIVGTYVLKANFPGLGSHVVNGGYMVHPKWQGHGIGTQMVQHSLEEAERLGFKAMQYNLVVATNTRAVELYQRLGFKIVGTLPKAFNHLTLGYVDAYVMHRFLE
ncbi:MAG: GNAT family N-acetyltransferase [Candidatus Babeliales bacterium]|jgi:ribosomal protein S18 acetylase RimI-like enzyme